MVGAAMILLFLVFITLLLTPSEEHYEAYTNDNEADRKPTDFSCTFLLRTASFLYSTSMRTFLSVSFVVDTSRSRNDNYALIERTDIISFSKESGSSTTAG